MPVVEMKFFFLLKKCVKVILNSIHFNQSPNQIKISENIKVRFFDENGWEGFGDFDESCVHHQYGIVLKTPKYKYENITAPVDVWIELYRPTDETGSEPLPFRYKPNPKPENSRKRARLDSSDIPTVVFSHEKTVNQKENNNQSTSDVTSSSDTFTRNVQSPGQKDEINSTVPDVEETIQIPDNLDIGELLGISDDFISSETYSKDYLNPDGMKTL